MKIKVVFKKQTLKIIRIKYHKNHKYHKNQFQKKIKLKNLKRLFNKINKTKIYLLNQILQKMNMNRLNKMKVQNRFKFKIILI